MMVLAAGHLCLDSLEPAVSAGCHAELARCLAEMSQGQWGDVADLPPEQWTLERYCTIARGKTGGLIGAALALGGHLAGAGPERTNLLMEAGRTLGAALQAHDDLEDLLEAVRSGVAPGDLTDGKCALPLVYALAACEADQRVRLLAPIRGAAEAGEARLLAEDLLASGAGAFTLVQAQAWEREARRTAAAAGLGPQQWDQELRRVGWPASK